MFDPKALQPIKVAMPPSGVFVLESHHRPGFKMQPVGHDFLKLVQPFAGAGWLVRDHVRIPLEPSDIVVVPARKRHYIEDNGTRPLGLYALCLSVPPGTVMDLRQFDSFHRFASPVWSGEVRNLIRRLLHEQTLNLPGAELIIPSLAWQAFGLVSRALGARRTVKHTSHDLPAVARVTAYAMEMRHSFYDRQSIDSVAASLGISRRHFSQLFREATGESWLAAIRRHRITHARRLLSETRRSVISIAFECGFDDVTTFYRTFKAREGTSPLAWRNVHGNKATEPK